MLADEQVGAAVDVYIIRNGASSWKTTMDGRKLASWLAIGVAVGASLGVVLDNIGLWVGLGVAAGAVIGAVQSRTKSS